MSCVAHCVVDDVFNTLGCHFTWSCFFTSSFDSFLRLIVLPAFIIALHCEYSGTCKYSAHSNGIMTHVDESTLSTQ